MATVEKFTFDKKHLNSIRTRIRKSKPSKDDIRVLKAHLKQSERYEKSLEKAIKAFEGQKAKIAKLRRSVTLKKLSPLFTGAKAKAVRAEEEAFNTLFEAHETRKRHLEDIRQTRGEVSDYLRKHSR